MFWLVNFDAKKFRTFLFFLNKNMNERKLLIDTDTRHTTSSGLQHSESFTSLAPFVGTVKIEHFSFLRWLVNFDSHCIFSRYDNISYILLLFRVFNSYLYSSRMSDKHTYVHRSRRNMDWRFICLHWCEFFVVSSEQIHSSCLKSV